jgi:hypothetical protein
MKSEYTSLSLWISIYLNIDYSRYINIYVKHAYFPLFNPYSLWYGFYIRYISAQF